MPSSSGGGGGGGGAFYLEDPWVHLLDSAPRWAPAWEGAEERLALRPGIGDGKMPAAVSPTMMAAAALQQQQQQQQQQYGALARWGASWR